jgi:hypothetical protein
VFLSATFEQVAGQFWPVGVVGPPAKDVTVSGADLALGPLRIALDGVRKLTQ